MWTALWEVSKGDYLYYKIPDHPDATENGYVLAHRVEAENKLGRPLLRSEVVHHVNHTKRDNRWENLEVMSRSDHTRLHRPIRQSVDLYCDDCGVLFKRWANQRKTLKGYKNAFCSRRCSGKHARKSQLAAIAIGV